MANELQTKLDAILEDKNTNLLPEHLKAGVTCLGVNGTLESGLAYTHVKLFATEEDMNTSVDNNVGDWALVYDLEKKAASNGLSATAIYLPKTIKIPEDTEDVYNVYYGGGTFSSNGMAGGFGMWKEVGMSGYQYILYDRTTTVGDKAGGIYTRTSQYGDYWLMSGTLSESGTSELETSFFQSLGFCTLTFTGVYEYNGTEWIIVPATNLTELDTTKILNGNTFYSETGLVTGTYDVTNYIPVSMVYGENGNQFVGTAETPYEYSNVRYIEKNTDCPIEDKYWVLWNNMMYVFDTKPTLELREFELYFCGEGVTYKKYLLQTTGGFGDITEGTISADGLYVENTMESYSYTWKWASNAELYGYSYDKTTSYGVIVKPLPAISTVLSTNKFISIDGSVLDGTYTPLDTSDATAVAEDIARGKTAYINGEKVEGTLYDTGTETGLGKLVSPILDEFGYDSVANSVGAVGHLENDKIVRTDALVMMQVPQELAVTNLEITPEKIVKGQSILGIEGTAESGSTEGVKLFETIEEMQADKTAKEGDLAVVYRSEIQNATVDSHFQTATFPTTVILPEALTDHVDIMYRATDDNVMFDCWGSLDANMFSMDCYTDNGRIRIMYESADGITYTRTDGGEETIDFGTEIYYYNTDSWNDAIGYFIQAGGMKYEGLFVAKNVPTNNYELYDVTKYFEGCTEKDLIAEPAIDANLVYEVAGKARKASGNVNIAGMYIDKNLENVYVIYNGTGLFQHYNGVYYTACRYNTVVYKAYVYNIANKTLAEYTAPEELVWTRSSGSIDGLTNVMDLLYIGNVSAVEASDTSDSSYIYYTVDGETYRISVSDIGVIRTINDLNANKYTDANLAMGNTFRYAVSYIPAPNQLDATADYVLEKQFMGANGVEAGTMQNTTNLSNKEIAIKAGVWASLSNLTPASTTTSFQSLFENYTGTHIPMLDMTNITSTSTMFLYAKNLVTIPELDFSKVVNTHGTFQRCTSLKTLPLLDLSSSTSTNNMFEGCTVLEEVNITNIDKVTDAQYMFQSCKALRKVTMTGASKVKYAQQMFWGCSSLETVPVLNMPSITNANITNMFSGCTSLSDESLNNILQTCINLPITSATLKTLKKIGLTEEQATKCKTLSNYQAFLDAGWTTGY